MLSASSQYREIDQRHLDRLNVDLSASVSTRDTVDDCEVSDVSLAGAKIRTLGRFELNQRVDLEVPVLGAIPSRVVWSRGVLFGVQFMSPLGDDELGKLPTPERAEDEDPASQSARADLEARLLTISRQLSDTDLDIVLGQIARLTASRRQ